MSWYLRVLCLLLAVATVLVLATRGRSDADTPWERLDEGLELGRFPSPRPAAVGDSMIRVLRIDPDHFDLVLANASAEDGGQPRTARQWAESKGLVAAINASMYQADHKTSVSLMQTRTHTNNRRLSKDKTILAFDRRRQGVPRIKIIDRQCDDFDTWKTRYGTLVQSIRMISCKGANVWSQQSRKWSTALIAVDESGRALFIHVRSPYSTHDLIEILKELPLDIDRAMYAEGGPEAQLFVRNGETAYEFVGRPESGIDLLPFGWPVPNVIGVKKRE